MMQALILKDGQLSYAATKQQPSLDAGEALIRIQVAGICSTDLEIIKGYAGFSGILGHEFVGIVETVADQEDAEWIGKRVVGGINVGCQRCAVCLSEGSEHCPNRTVLGIINRDGIFADYVTLPVVNLFEVPAGISNDMAVFTEPVAAALRIRQQLTLSPTSSVAVVGPGRLGTLIGQALALDGTPVVVLGRREASLQLPASLGLQTALVDEMDDNQFDVVVEATGNEAGLAHSLRLVRPMGTLVLKSTFHGSATVDLTKLVVAEITVIGSRCGPFAPALRLLEQGKIQVEPLIEGRYPYREFEAAFSHAAQSGVRKILLHP